MVGISMRIFFFLNQKVESNALTTRNFIEEKHSKERGGQDQNPF
jgi:hypothetical protein